MKRNFFYCSIIFSITILALSECRVYQAPNADDIDYWHNYNVKYLRKILSSSNVDSRVAKNVILFIGDGMSLATVAAGRVFKGQLEGKSGEETELVFENFPHVALSKTYNTDSQVPDSAATATALFSGIKTSIRSVGLNNPKSKTEAHEKDRLKNIMDWAQAAGKRTGIVTTTRISHATPAAAYAYSPHRDYECDQKVPESMKSHFKDIARQLIENKPGNKMNVIFGGGRDFLGASDKNFHEAVHFGGGAEVSCNRTDKVNLVKKYLEQFSNDSVVKYVKNLGELMDVLTEVHDLDHVLGLFANNHMSYNTLRKQGSDGEPSLTEMTKAAIKILGNKKNKNGYVLMVEGGKIDHAHHQNHARFALEEFVELENAIRNAVEMTSRDDTLIIVTSDHAHAMVYNGYAKRGNDILGFANKEKAPAYETVIDPINKLIDTVEFDAVFYSLDWHPSDHVSFIDNIKQRPIHPTSPLNADNAAVYDTVIFSGPPPMRQRLWPRHCVQDTWGSELHKDLKIVDNAIKVYKGTNPEVDSYSVFWDNKKMSDTSLCGQLKQKGITDIYVCGLAYDVCVGATATDSLSAGYRTILIDDCCRGVDLQDIESTKETVLGNHGVIVHSREVKAMVEGRDRRPELGFKLAMELKNAENENKRGKRQI